MGTQYKIVGQHTARTIPDEFTDPRQKIGAVCYKAVYTDEIEFKRFGKTHYLRLKASGFNVKVYVKELERWYRFEEFDSDEFI